MDEQGRICTKCNSFKSWSMFHKNSTRPNGFTEVCKICKNKMDRQRRANKKDEISTKIKKDFNIENTLTIKQLAKRWGVNIKTMQNNMYRGKCIKYLRECFVGTEEIGGAQHSSKITFALCTCNLS